MADRRGSGLTSTNIEELVTMATRKDRPEIIKTAYLTLRLSDKRRKAQERVDAIDREIAAAQAKVRELAGGQTA
jgi:hypothetical protein